MSQGKRVLFLEDEVLILLTGRLALEEAGFAVLEARTIDDARGLVKWTGSFDLLILTVDVPDGDGLEFCAELRANGVDCPVLIQTGYSVGYKLAPALKAGANGYLEKPYHVSQLVNVAGILIDFPGLVIQETKAKARRGQNRPDVDVFAARMVAQAQQELLGLQPAPGSYTEHPKVDDKTVRTLPLTEGEVGQLRKLLGDVGTHLSERPDDGEEKRKLIVELTRFVAACGQWVGGRATTAADEAIKLLIKGTVLTYAAHATGLNNALLKLILALTASAAGH